MNTILDSLKFVQGAVAKKDFLPAMTHYAIKDGVIRSYNGKIALSAPIPIALTCFPKAVTFHKAIQNCNETVSMALTPSGRLSIKSGSFKALIECVPEEPLHPKPSGDLLTAYCEEIHSAFKKLYDIIGEDASRAWTNGIRLSANSCHATCNVVLAEYWHSLGLPLKQAINIPRDAVKEVVRVGVPESILLDERSVSFLYEDGKSIRAQLIAEDWPDVGALLDKKTSFNGVVEITKELFEVCDNLKAFTDKTGTLFFDEDLVRTSLGEEGASYQMSETALSGAYNYEKLYLLKNLATHVNFGNYPDACPFFGDKVRGIIIGMKRTDYVQTQ